MHLKLKQIRYLNGAIETPNADENAVIIEQATSMFNPAGAQRAVYQSAQKTTYFNIR